MQDIVECPPAHYNEEETQRLPALEHAAVGRAHHAFATTLDACSVVARNGKLRVPPGAAVALIDGEAAGERGALRCCCCGAVALRCPG